MQLKLSKKVTLDLFQIKGKIRLRAKDLWEAIGVKKFDFDTKALFYFCYLEKKYTNDKVLFLFPGEDRVDWLITIDQALETLEAIRQERLAEYPQVVELLPRFGYYLEDPVIYPACSQRLLGPDI